MNIKNTQEKGKILILYSLETNFISGQKADIITRQGYP